MNGLHAAKLACALITSGLSILQSGCGVLSTTASLQVDVDVYKGPLSQSLEVQIGDALGTIESGENSVRLFISELTGVYPFRANEHCKRWQESQEQTNANSESTENGAKPLSKTAPYSDVIWKPAKNGTKLPTEDDTTLPMINLCFDAVRALRYLDSAERELRLQLQGHVRAKRDLELALDMLDSTIADFTESDRKAEEPVAKKARKLLTESLNLLNSNVPFNQVLAAFSSGQNEIALTSNQRVAEILRQAYTWLGQAAATPDPKPTFNHELVQRATSLLRNFAESWGSAYTGNLPRSQVARDRIVTFTVICARHAELISTRVDLYVAQRRDVKAGQLHTKDYLRDASATIYLNLYEWYGVDHDKTIPGGRAFGGLQGTRINGMTVEDRIRAAQALFADHYWANVNQVFASGQGEVRMALIKDDIGNWNLKSFDNNPEELLAAYRDATLAGTKAITKIVKDGASPGKGVLQLASQVAKGNVGGAEKMANIGTALEKSRIEARNAIADIAQALSDKRKTLDDSVTAAEQLVSTRKSELDKATENADKKALELRVVKAQKAEAIQNGAIDRVNTLNDSEVILEKAASDLNVEVLKAQRALEHAEEAQKTAVQTRNDVAAAAFENAKAEVRAHERTIRSIRTMSLPPSPKD